MTRALGPGRALRTRAEALWLLALVIEDAAALRHDAPFARQLVSEAEAALRAR